MVVTVYGTAQSTRSDDYWIFFKVYQAMYWTHLSVNLDETLNWRSFIKIWMGPFKMVDGTFYGLCKIFIFSKFHKIFIEKRTKMAVFQVLYHQAGIHGLIFNGFIRSSWANLWVRESLSQENCLLFWLEMDSILKLNMTWLHTTIPLARKGIHWPGFRRP